MLRFFDKSFDAVWINKGVVGTNPDDAIDVVFLGSLDETVQDVVLGASINEFSVPFEMLHQCVIALGGRGRDDNLGIAGLMQFIKDDVQDAFISMKGFQDLSWKTGRAQTRLYDDT